MLKMNILNMNTCSDALNFHELFFFYRNEIILLQLNAHIWRKKSQYDYSVNLAFLDFTIKKKYI